MIAVPPATSGMYWYELWPSPASARLVGQERDLGGGEVDLPDDVELPAGRRADALVVDAQPLPRRVGAPLVERDLHPGRAGAGDRRPGDAGAPRAEHSAMTPRPTASGSASSGRGRWRAPADHPNRPWT